MRESARDKGARYLTEGRVIVTRVDPRAIVATVRGEGAVYETWWTRTGWACDCPHEARTTNCSHLYALQRITAADLEVDR